MRSPGRPGVNQRETKQAFWARIAAGAASEDAALASGVSQPVGTRWFREAGGMAPISMFALSGRFLSFGEREELALLNAQRLGIREIARRMERSPSTISRELRRNAETRGGVLRYRATVAQWKAQRAAARPKAANLPRTHGCGAMCKTDLPAPLPTRAAHRFGDRRCHGRDDAMAAVLTGGGASAGVRSKSVVDC